MARGSQSHELGRKLRLHASTGVSGYSVADGVGRRILRFDAPEGEAYGEQAEFAFCAAVPLATLPELIVDTARLG